MQLMISEVYSVIYSFSLLPYIGETKKNFYRAKLMGICFSQDIQISLWDRKGVSGLIIVP